jgi:hypothetical protein
MKCFIMFYRSALLVSCGRHGFQQPLWDCGGPERESSWRSFNEGLRVSIPQPRIQRRHIDWCDCLVPRRGDRRHFRLGQETLASDENLAIGSASVQKALSQGAAEIELPDEEGFLAELILRLVRGAKRPVWYGTEAGYPVGRRSIAARAAGRRRRSPPQTVETQWLNTGAGPLFVELAQRQAQILAPKGGTV